MFLFGYGCMLRDVVCLVVKLSHHLYIPVIVRPSYAGPTHSICAQVVVVALNESFLVLFSSLINTDGSACLHA